ncbi:response regulator transcription factor [Sphingobacterium daejeonense]|nr:response regulator [Sphingobacterium daejeonense]VTP96351.1 Staphylococcal respiratory response protein A [Sphingobacterium daejeonense]
MELLKSENFDLLISDIMMPFASGIEILAELKNLQKKMPVLMLSSMGQEEIILEAFDLGAADFMVKPFSPNELIIRINRLLRK